MKPTRSRSHLPRRHHARGAMLLEALIASVVFAVGVLGAYQGIIIASRQNSLANRAVRASAIAAQLRVALETQGYQRLTAANGVLASPCSGDTEVKKAAGGLDGVSGSCVIDVDLFEDGPPAEGFALQPGYNSAVERPFYKRVLVLMPDTTEMRQVAVVVSWYELGAQRHHKQIVMLLKATRDNGSILL